MLTMTGCHAHYDRADRSTVAWVQQERHFRAACECVCVRASWRCSVIAWMAPQTWHHLARLPSISTRIQSVTLWMSLV